MVNDERVEKHPIIIWFKTRWLASKKRDNKLTFLAGLIISFIVLIEIWFVVPGIPTGLGTAIDFIIFTIIYSLAFLLIKALITPLFKFFYVTKSTYLFCMVVILFLQSYFITKQIGWNMKASIIFSIVVTLLSLIFSLIISYLWFNSKKWVWVSLVLFSFVTIGAVNMVKQEQLKQISPVVEPQILQEVLIAQQDEYIYEPIQLKINPAEQGPFSFHFIEYGNNVENQLDTAEEQYKQKLTDLTYINFPSVDGSSLLQDWSWTKELYWGFTESDIPIRGKLWIPNGEGPFPIVYIMHGNHISEVDSSAGYHYLGELLASHGYIVSSIDANFLNYSAWSGIVDDDQLLRAWLFLSHIDSFYKANLLPVDWDNVALIGHSRGGQAAAMAVDIKRWIEDGAQVAILDKVNINAVIAIAPTDYTVDGKLARLDNINYLTIHGTLDSDLTEFFGERQFERTTIGSGAYKASVIMYGANHGQFNEAWGKYDDQFPAALILNTEHILDEQKQQLAAKVYISGFLQSVFDQYTPYRQLFQDHRVAKQFLPVAGYITQYEDEFMDDYYSFEKARDIKDISSSALLDYEIVELKGRNGTSKYNDVLHVNWNIGYSKLLFPINKIHKGFQEKPPIAAFVFQMAKTKPSTKPEAIAQMNIEVDFITTESIARVDLKNSYSLLDPYIPAYLKLDILEEYIKKGKYAPKDEPYLQTYIIPISLIENHIQEGTNWNSKDMTGIQFWFKDKTGSIMLDDIGVIYEGGNYVKYE